MKKSTAITVRTETASHLTDYLLVDPKLLFEKEPVYEWARYAVNPEGEIMFRVEVGFSVFGLQGTMGLMIPPSDQDSLDSWEGIKPSDTWDCWACLTFITTPDNNYQHNFDSKITIAYELQSFFSADGQVVKVLETALMSDFSEASLFHYDSPDDLIEDWKQYKEIFRSNLGLTSIDQSKA